MIALVLLRKLRKTKAYTAHICFGTDPGALNTYHNWTTESQAKLSFRTLALCWCLLRTLFTFEDE